MKQVCKIMIAVCLSLIFCGQVQAEQHSGPYVGVFYGGAKLANAKASDDLGSFGLKFDPAPVGSAVLGWDFERGNPVGEGRIEIEYARRSNALDKVTFVEGSLKGSGTVRAESMLLNFFGVFHDGSRWAPYGGFGLGAARMEASYLKAAGLPIGSGSSVVFAYQAGCGVDLALTNHLNLDLGYRYFGSAKPRFSEASGRKFEMDYGSHNAVLGLRVGF